MVSFRAYQALPKGDRMNVTVAPDDSSVDDRFTKMEAAFWGLAAPPEPSPRDAQRSRRRAALKRQRLARRITRMAARP
jgi:hypothetical protein